MKVCIPILSRQAFGRLEPLIKELDQSDHDLVIIVGGSACISQYGDVREQLKADAQVLFRPPDDSCGSMAFATGLALQELVPEFNRIQPDLVFAHADRYETLAVAIAASYSNIPLAHTQGGEWTGSIDNKVRYAVTQLADYHFVATEKSRERLLPIVRDPRHLYNVGCPSIDLARHVMETDVPRETVWAMLNAYGTGHEIKDDYVLVVYHPDTTMARDDILMELNQLYLQIKGKEQTCVWMMPNIDAGSEMISKFLRQHRDWQHPKIRFIANLPANDYLHVMKNCLYALGNSSSFIREGAYMGVPAILIGFRQYGRELGPNVDRENFSAWAEPLTKNRNQSLLYGDGTAAKQIVEVINGI